MLNTYSLPELLKTGAEQLGIFISPHKINKFITYLEELKLWNKKLNLTSLVDDKKIIIKHFLDSLSCFLVFKRLPEQLVDIGTGAGFPSLPLKILLPEITCTLIEVTRKKADFLEHLLKKLELTGVTIINARAEDRARGNLRESFDVALGRAVAKLNVLLEYALAYVKVDGYLVAQSGEWEVKTKEAEKALLIMGGKVAEVKTIQLPFTDEHRSLILIQKTKNTPLKYPRRAGMPQKKPL